MFAFKLSLCVEAWHVFYICKKTIAGSLGYQEHDAFVDYLVYATLVWNFDGKGIPKDE